MEKTQPKISGFDLFIDWFRQHFNVYTITIVILVIIILYLCRYSLYNALDALRSLGSKKIKNEKVRKVINMDDKPVFLNLFYGFCNYNLSLFN